MTNKATTIQNKIVTLDQLKHLVNGWRIKNKKIVFTNGCFDILHKGHVSLLLQAIEEGDKLIVGLNTDQSVKRLKGEKRPINTEQDRALLLAAQTYVDAVVLFDEDTPLQLIQSIKPDVLVKGGDYKETEIIGANEVKSNGGRVVIISLEQGYATTNTIEKIKGK